MSDIGTNEQHVSEYVLYLQFKSVTCNYHITNYVSNVANALD